MIYIPKIEILENPLEIGQVKKIFSNGGKNVDSVELLFSKTIKATFTKENGQICLVISDTQFKIPELSCILNSSSIRDLIIALKEMYNELPEESEV